MARQKKLKSIVECLEEEFLETKEDKIIDEQKKTDERAWISLGNRMFHIEDVQSMYIQANHLIINFDYTDKQVVIHFGYGKEGEKNAKIVFESLREMYGAYKVDLPEDANLYPDLMKTAYGDKISKEIQAQVKNITQEYKKRHLNKLKKCLNELDELKKKMNIDQK
jgi:hypothetical protein